MNDQILIPTAATSTQFAYDCIKLGCYRNRLPSWDRINDTLPGKIRLTDIDGMVEYGGRFVFIEHKRANGDVTGGQRIALQQLSKLPNVLVIITRDPMPDDEHAIDLEARFYCGGQPSRIDGTYQYEFEPYLADDLLRAIHTHLGTKSTWDMLR